MNSELQTAAEQPQQIAPLAAEEAVFKLEQRKAVALAASTIVPDSFREKPGNCLIALELAGRMGCSPLAVMQNLAIVHGKPSFSGQFLIGLVNASPRFSGKLSFEVRGGEDPKAKSYKVRAYATHRESGEICRGSWIDWPMIDGEGWSKKNGSKWLTMPEQMFQYRAAAFFTRVHAPELALGFMSREEVEDVYGPAGTANVRRIDDLKQALLASPTAQPELARIVSDADPGGAAAAMANVGEAAAATAKVFDSFSKAEVLEAIERSRNRDQLDEARDLIRHVPDTEARRELVIAGDQKQAALEESAATVAGGPGLFPEGDNNASA